MKVFNLYSLVLVFVVVFVFAFCNAVPDAYAKAGKGVGQQSGHSVYSFTVKGLETSGEKGKARTRVLLSVDHVLAGRKIKQLKFVRDGRPPKALSVGTRGFVNLSPAELEHLFKNNEPQPSTQFWWFLISDAEAPTSPPGGGAEIPGEPAEPDDPDDPPKEDPAETEPSLPDDSFNTGTPDTGGDIGGGDFGNGVNFAEALCEGVGEAGSIDNEECMAGMLDLGKELAGGGTDDAENGGYTGGGDTDDSRDDTGDWDTGNLHSW